MALARRPRRTLDIWPGFVDALASLLIILVFVLMVFMVAQFILNRAISGRDEALDRLNQQINELTEMLDLERKTSADLRLSVAQLSAELQSSVAERDSLTSRVEALEAEVAAALSERDALRARVDVLAEKRKELESRLGALTRERDDLTARLSALGEEKEALSARVDELAAARESLERRLAAVTGERDEARRRLAATTAERDRLREDLAAATARAGKAKERAGRLEAELADALRTIRADKETIEAKLAELARLAADIRILRSLRDELEAKLAAAEKRAATAEAAAAERAGELEKLGATLAEREKSLAAATRMSDEARRQVELLNRQILSLREKLARIEAALEASEAEVRKQKVEIVNLGRRLNEALASKVAELARYRSEFFGRLRRILGNRPDIRIVGDRFVVQSEVLFASGRADLGEEGKARLASLADTLREIAATIPEDIDWILRVDGHTDRRPIHTARFPSNWELSTARAISVVRFLIEKGLPPERLAATGFGEFQPIDDRDTEEAYRRNRRIEFKLTQR